jgi:hypothetical protein
MTAREHKTAERWEGLIEAFVAGLPANKVEPWQYLDSLLLLANGWRLPRVHTDNELIELIADEIRWQALDEQCVPEVVPEIGGEPAPTLVENILAENPPDVHAALREYFALNRVPIPNDAAINKMLDRHQRRRAQASGQHHQQAKPEPLPLFEWAAA